MKITEIDGLIRYVDNLSLQCGWSRDERDIALSDLKQIRDRIVDPRLYLGVVGEFSAGKSTFINALLGVELLREDILQGTTCAPTFIGAGKEFDVEVVFTDKTVRKYSSTLKLPLRILRRIARRLGFGSWMKDVLHARDFIDKYTAEEECSCDVERVVLTLPIKMPFFTENVVLVDTPGVNAENARHQNVTESAMRRYCDLVVTLTVASTPCPQSLMTFLHQNEASVEDRCIALITKIDQIRKAERTRQIRFIQDRFKSEGINLLGLHAAAPYYVVHPDDADTDDRKDCRNQFSEVAAKILRQLAENKDALIAKKTKELLDGVINVHVVPVVKNAEAIAEQKIEQYNAVRLLTYGDFREEWLKICRGRIDELRIKDEMIGPFIRSLTEVFAANIQTKIKEAKSSSAAVRAYSRGFTEECVKNRISPAIQDKFGRWSMDEDRLRNRCLADVADAFSQYGIALHENGKNTNRDKKRPALRIPCHATSYPSFFAVKYWSCMILSGIVLSFLALLIVGFAVDSGCWWLLLALVVVLGLYAVVVDVDLWRRKALSSLDAAKEKLFVSLNEVLRSFVREVCKFDIDVIENGIAEYGKYKREMQMRVKEKARNVRQEQDRISLAREALPILTNALENIKTILAQSVPCDKVSTLGQGAQ